MTGSVYQQAFQRLHDAQAILDLDIDEIQIVTGVRRSGKSTLQKHLINHLATLNDPIREYIG